jgi:hypothetical protein
MRQYNSQVRMRKGISQVRMLQYNSQVRIREGISQVRMPKDIS